jgi:hypothetical protein
MARDSGSPDHQFERSGICDKERIGALLPHT